MKAIIGKLLLQAGAYLIQHPEKIKEAINDIKRIKDVIDSAKK